MEGQAGKEGGSKDASRSKKGEAQDGERKGGAGVCGHVDRHHHREEDHGEGADELVLEGRFGSTDNSPAPERALQKKRDKRISQARPPEPPKNETDKRESSHAFSVAFEHDAHALARRSSGSSAMTAKGDGL